MATRTSLQSKNPFVDLVVSIIIPSLILMKLNETLGAAGALVLALAFPLGQGIYEFVKYKKVQFIPILGVVSVFLTGGIGLLRLDAQWLAVKEAAIPAVIGVAVLISTRTRYPLLKTLLYNPAVINTALIDQKLDEKNIHTVFEQKMLHATYALSGTFFFSAVMNYILAKLIVVSPSGSTAFNEELGKLVLASYPVIALPSMIMTFGILIYLWRTIQKLTGLTLEEIIHSANSAVNKK